MDQRQRSNRALWIIPSGLILLSCLVSCAAPRQAPPALPAGPGSQAASASRAEPAVAQASAGRTSAELASGPAGETVLRPKSRWVAADWSDLPGWEQDAPDQAWPALLRSCERPLPAFAKLCPEMRELASAGPARQRQWLMGRLRPYRVQDLDGKSEGLLTSYFEPVLPARRLRAPDHTVALHKPPADLAERMPWFSRREIDTVPQAMQALRGREIAWLSDPIDAMLLHIQGSGRLELIEADGRLRQVRVAFAGSNGQPYRSIQQWLREQGVRNLNPWPQATKAWAAQHPQRVAELLWSNPRYIFFREEAIGEPTEGPRGALGVPLSAGRSIAVDPGSIPHGAPVWLVSRGPTVQLARLVAAQDSGSAIVGAVRADYFAGTGAQAGQFASRVHQRLELWVLWPR